MPLWLQITLLAGAILILPVLLRLYAGDDPRNRDDDAPSGDQDEGGGPDLLIAA